MGRRYFVMSAMIAAFGTGCADDGTSLRIECPVPPQQGGNACTWSPETEFCVLNGTLNLAEAVSYQLVLKATSGLAERESEIPLRPETNNMDVTSAEIALLSTRGDLIDFGELPNPFSVNTTGRIPVGGSGIANIQAVPPDYVQAMAANSLEETEGTVIVRLSLNARTDGDVGVTSREWTWPIDLVDEPGSITNCIPSDDVQFQCTPGQDGDYLPLCSRI